MRLQDENDPGIHFTPAQLSDPEKVHLPPRPARAAYGADRLYDVDLKAPLPVMARLSSKRSFVTPSGRRFVDLPVDDDDEVLLPKTGVQRIRASLGDFSSRLPQLGRRV